MEIIKDFTDKADMERVIAEMTARGSVLKEVQHHFDGNHLVFEIADRDLFAEVDNLKARVEKLEKK